MKALRKRFPNAQLWKADGFEYTEYVIFSQPDAGASNTGTVQGGEFLAVEEVVEGPGPEGQRYLRLADGRGWVADRGKGRYNDEEKEIKLLSHDQEQAYIDSDWIEATAASFRLMRCSIVAQSKPMILIKR